MDWHKVTEESLIEILNKTYKLGHKANFRHGAPLFLSSLNNWIMTRCIDVKIFSQLLKGENEEFIKQSLESKKQNQSPFKLNRIVNFE